MESIVQRLGAYTVSGLAVALVASLLGLGWGGLFHVLPDCETEDAIATVCKWDASERDNGQGQDFIVVGKHIIYM